MFALMTGMGLTLTVADFRRIAQAPAATIIGTLLQLVVMPMAGIALALFFELPPLLAAGLVIIAACPGGMFSNMYVHFAQANTVLSITLTATATMVSLFTLPLWVQAIFSLSGAEGAGFEMPVLQTAAELAGLTIVPVLVGMYARFRFPESVRFEKNLTRFGALAIIVIVTYDGFQRPELPVAEFQQALPAVALLSLAAWVAGLGLPLLFRISLRDTTTIAVEMVVKNGLLGLVIARRSLEFEATLPILTFGLFTTPAALAILLPWWYVGRKREAAQTPTTPDGALS